MKVFGATTKNSECLTLDASLLDDLLAALFVSEESIDLLYDGGIEDRICLLLGMLRSEITNKLSVTVPLFDSLLNEGQGFGEVGLDSVPDLLARRLFNLDGVELDLSL